MQNASGKNPGSNLTINDFEILNKLGKGSFGVVYKVKRKSNKNTYVLKQINISSMKSKMRSIALNEVKILSSLENPYVVKYYDSFIERDNLNIIMEYCEGGDLAQYIKSHMGKPLSEQKIWKFFIQMCIGMRYIHSKKILHRDIKSLNIFLTKDGDIRIGDLGVAKVLAESVNFAHTMVGTPYYLSPEMCEEKPYNEKSDIWALGCVLYEMCTQRHPFQAHSQGTLILKIIKGHYTPISGTYSSELSEIVNQCLNKDYKKRLTASALLLRPAMIEKAKTLGITVPEVDKKPIVGLNPIIEEPAVVNKSKPPISQNKEKAKEQEVKKEKKVKEQENNEGRINVFAKVEPQRIDAKVSPSNRIIENKAPAFEVKNAIPKAEPAKVEWIKVNAEVKPTPIVNEKPEINPAKNNPPPQRHKDNALGPEIVAKASSEGKKAPYIVVSGEKVANKEAQVVNKDRVRKGAPVELGRQAKIAGSQQKLVKKIGGEPLRINRPVPVLLEDKEKAPIVRPAFEQNKGSQKNLLGDGPSAHEIDEVKNLPDIVKANSKPKEVVTPQSFNLFKEPSKPVNNFRDAVQKEQKPITEEKPSNVQATVEIVKRYVQEPVGKGIVNKVEQPASRKVVEEVKIEDKASKEEDEKENVKEIQEVQEVQKEQEVIVKSQEDIEQEDNKPEYEEEEEEEEAETNDEEFEGQAEENPDEVPKQALQFGYNAFPKTNWKISEGERNAKIVRKGDAQDVEEYKTFDSDLNDRDDEFEVEGNLREEKQGNGDIQEESNEESSGEEEENEEKEDEEEEEEEDQEEVDENQDEDLKGLSKVVLEKRLNKSMRKREKIKDLVREIRSNQFIKSLGDDRFGQIINFFRLKLESDEEINEEDQDEIEQFLKGKLPGDIQVQVIYNIYRLLGLQIELQRCEDDIKKYGDVLA